MRERDVIERRLERARHRSLGEVLLRYGVPICRLYRWRRQVPPAFPPDIRVVGEREPFFLFLQLVRWEIELGLTRGRRRRPAQ